MGEAIQSRSPYNSADYKHLLESDVHYLRKVCVGALVFMLPWSFIFQYFLTTANHSIWFRQILQILVFGVYASTFWCKSLVSTPDRIQGIYVFLAFSGATHAVGMAYAYQLSSACVHYFYLMVGGGCLLMISPRVLKIYTIACFLASFVVTLVVECSPSVRFMLRVGMGFYIACVSFILVPRMNKRGWKEEELENNRRNLLTNIGNLNEAKEKAESLSQVKNIFLAQMSHEIRGPMNNLLGMTHLCLKTGLTDEQREYLEAVRYSGENLLTLINDILDITKIESGELRMESGNFHVRRTLLESMRAVAFRADEKNLALECAVDDNVEDEVVGDPHRLRQIIINLVGNAVKFTERGFIVVRAERHAEDAPDVLRFSVTDTGIGISPESQTRLFTAFTQADESTTRKYGGTGLGLSICKQLVELMGGRIWLDSKTGMGSTFTFTAHMPASGRVHASGPRMRRRFSTTIYTQKPGEDLEAMCIKAELKDRLGSPQRNVSFLSEPTPCNLLSNAGRMRHIPQIQLLQQQVASGESAGIATPVSWTGTMTLSPKLAAAENASLFPPVASVLNELSNTKSAPPGPTPVNSSSMMVDLRDRAAHPTVVETPVPSSPVRLTLPSRRPFRRMSSSLSASVTSDGSGPASETYIQPEHSVISPLTARRVLIVDDNDVNLKLLTHLLTRQSYRPDIATSGRQAIAMHSETPYDVILMDCHMPDIDGYDATRQIREIDGPGRHTLIIGETADVCEPSDTRCKDCGMDGKIHRLVSLRVLEKALAAWLCAKPL